MAEQFTNFSRATLMTSINASDTTIVVSDGTVFPSTGTFRVKIENEIIKISARSGANLTVSQRGAEGTTADSHTSGVNVLHLPTAGSITDYMNERVQVGLYSALPSAASCRMYYPTDGPCMMVSDGTSWYATSHRRPFTGSDLSAFSWHNQGTASITQYGQSQFMTDSNVQSNTIRCYRRATASTFTATACLQACFSGANNSFYAGLIAFSGTNTLGYAADVRTDWQYGSSNWSGNTRSSESLIGTNLNQGTPFWFRMQVTTTDILLSVSFDGYNFIPHRSQALTGNLVTVSHVGVYFIINSFNAGYQGQGVYIHEFTYTT